MKKARKSGKAKDRVEIGWGVYTKIGEKLGISRQAVWKAVNVTGNPEIIDLVLAENNRRKRRYERAQKKLLGK